MIGFDDITMAELLTPALTTVAAPLRLMGRRSVGHLLATLSDPRTRGSQLLVLPTQLVVRASTAPRGTGPRPGRRAAKPDTRERQP